MQCFVFAFEWDDLSALLGLGGSGEDLGNASPDELGALSSVDGSPDSSLLVVLDDGAGLVVVSSETLLESLGIVV